MKTLELKVTRIGNSRGVRLPAATLRRYRIGSVVLMQETADGVVLRPVPTPGGKLSWEDTARAMAASGEDWSDWDRTPGDASSDLPWEHPVPPSVQAWARESAARERRAKAASRARAKP